MQVQENKEKRNVPPNTYETEEHYITIKTSRIPKQPLHINQWERRSQTSK
jgi:hypothetical protein